ncbi:hypothetical protein CWO89_44555 [Bradyrhizobium sp. Leo170]|nr:hypothetical protein CWO89_44555 [Bradyrhizobium sp. Leo170]
MPYETFERMAVRFAIEQIYDDRLIPRSTLNAVATLAIADKVAKAGFQAFTVQKDETKGPQIIGVRDGIPSSVIVRADAYPNAGDIADIDDARLAELIEEHMLRKRDLYYASVTLINAEARNDYEKGVLLHNGSFRMSVDQFTLLTENFEH